MEIIMRRVAELTPYAKNAKKHDDKQIANVANSIKRFGWQQPIVIDEDGVVVIGHCRLAAAKKLKMREVPCTVASGLTHDEIRELRIADNKTNESPWDLGLLAEDIEGLEFEGFELDGVHLDLDVASSEPKHNEAERTGNAYNLGEYDEDAADGFYQMPKLHPVAHVPKDLIGFNYVLTSGRKEAGVHFFVDDYQFERVWSQPQMYLDKLAAYDCMLTPDFSLYTEMPMAMKIWNVYRSRLIGQIAQRMGIIVIPTVSWCEPATYDFCFDGLPKNGTLAISTIGVKKGGQAYELWQQGVQEMIKRLSPRTLLVYGGDVAFDFGTTKVVHYSNSVTERMKSHGQQSLPV